MAENINHPSYYGGESNPYEAIKVIEAWGFMFSAIGYPPLSHYFLKTLVHQ